MTLATMLNLIITKRVTNSLPHLFMKKGESRYVVIYDQTQRKKLFCHMRNHHFEDIKVRKLNEIFSEQILVHKWVPPITWSYELKVINCRTEGLSLNIILIIK